MCGDWEIRTDSPISGDHFRSGAAGVGKKKVSLESYVYIAMYGQTVTSFGKTVHL